jgi:two-component system cell cycle sensor histidine kinase/response regulator CckA
MSEPTVRILLVEDDPSDAELMGLLFENEGLRVELERVDDKASFERALLSGNCDLILSDYNVPGFSGLEALRLYRQVGLEIPFLLVSGTIGEEAAVACLKAGAHDYVMKRNLKRLVPAIRRALQDYSDRNALRVMQKRYEQIFEKASEGICLLNGLGELQFFNERLAQILGCSAGVLQGYRLLELPDPLPEGALMLQLAGPLGAKSVWASLTLAPLSDGLVLGMVTDMTFTRHLEMQLQQAQKMEALGRLAGGIAHDFNNLLSTIIGFTEIAQEELSPEGEAGACFEEVLRAARRGAALTRQLLIVGRRQAAAPEVMGINHGVEELQLMLRRLLGPDVELEMRCTACPDTILLDRTHFAQVLMNLVINARDAMPTGGLIRIVTDNQGERVRLTVSDQGIGMSEEIKASIFEPFFTTKEAGKGTGLGLSTVYSIVKGSQAVLDLQSRPGEGAVFTISWPPGEGTVEAERPVRPPVRQSQNRTILVAEDSQPVRQVFVALLERQGYQVLQAADAGEALRVEKAHQGSLDLLLSDVMMPGLKGPELARLLRARRPEMRVILTSGFGSAVDDPEDQADGFLEKPVEAQRLLESVREVLGV